MVEKRDKYIAKWENLEWKKLLQNINKEKDFIKREEQLNLHVNTNNFITL